MYQRTIAGQPMDADDEPKSESDDAPASGKRTKRKRLFILLGIGVALAGGSYNAYDELVASQHVSTDNAYVGADVAQITPLISASVAQVMVGDTQAVKRGDVLVKLDDTDAKLALSRAEADLASATRRVRGVVATGSGLSAQIVARAADEQRAAAQLVAARSDVEKARIDLDRRQALAASGSVSGEELTIARNGFATASANLASAQAAGALAAANRKAAIGNRDANTALTDGASVADNPEVAAARVVRDQARIDLARTVIRAPVDGVVSRRQVQVGQRVQAGTMLMAIVPIAHVYVDANFKEVQLAKVAPGQAVTLTSDLYGGKVEYHGTVAGFSGGTGAAFAVVPAQNATGNWIKVVQRLPVRIELDPRDLARHPLRVGLSMNADIDVSGATHDG